MISDWRFLYPFALISKGVFLFKSTPHQLKEFNAQVVNTTTQLSNARIARNEILYKLDTGLTDTALAVKNYIKALFGATSPQYKQVSSLKFTNPR